MIISYISIHSLRMEGDPSTAATYHRRRSFQSTPSVWRETDHGVTSARINPISIHSLRMEGDIAHINQSDGLVISIHSLRMEGDKTVAFIAYRE